jgi:hypothetical protein
MGEVQVDVNPLQKSVKTSKNRKSTALCSGMKGGKRT